MADDIKAKLESLKDLRGQMKDWKKDDLRKKKGIPQPKEQEDEKKEQESEGQGQGQPESTLAKLISKLMENK